MTDVEHSFSLKVSPTLEGVRVDKALAQLLPEYSRAAIQAWLKQGCVLLKGKSLKPSDKLRGDESLLVSIPKVEPAGWLAEEMALEVIYEDADLFVINKPTGLVVHPGAGNADGTLLNGLLFLDRSLRTLPRAGIVHRLDKDTSGLMVVARSEVARLSLIEQLQARSVSREYVAVVNGVPVTGETIDQPIGRNHHDRLKMAVTERGKEAVTHFRVSEKYRCHSLLDVKLETGRTHQIRVHMSWRGLPLVGDGTYGARVKLPPAAGQDLITCLQEFGRQALHARRLSLIHPISGEEMSWQQDLPIDMVALIDLLALDRDEAKNNDN